MKAIIDGTVIAEAPSDQLISIEGNWYFPPTAVKEGVLTTSPTPYTCPWKGECQYYTATVGGTEYRDTAWAYPVPMASAIEKVGKDFSGYVAFWRAAHVTE